jgi:hypothetical protein
LPPKIKAAQDFKCIKGKFPRLVYPKLPDSAPERGETVFSFSASRRFELDHPQRHDRKRLSQEKFMSLLSPTTSI